MAGRGTWSVRDYSGEQSAVSMPGTNMNAGNIAAQTGLIGDLSDAIQAVILGYLFKESAFAFETAIAGSVTDPFAQRELKWLVTLEDSGGILHNMSIPTPDLQFLVAGSDLADLSGAEMVALIAAIEAYYKANGTLAVTVSSIRLVGRNL